MMIIGQRLWCRPDLIQDFKKRLDQTRLVNLPSSHQNSVVGLQRGVARPSRRAARSAMLTSSRSNNYNSYLHSKTLRSSKVWRTTRKCLQHSRLWQGWRQHLRVKYMKHKSTNAGNSASLQMTMNTSFSRARAPRYWISDVSNDMNWVFGFTGTFFHCSILQYIHYDPLMMSQKEAPRLPIWCEFPAINR